MSITDSFLAIYATVKNIICSMPLLWWASFLPSFLPLSLTLPPSFIQYFYWEGYFWCCPLHASVKKSFGFENCLECQICGWFEHAHVFLDQYGPFYIASVSALNKTIEHQYFHKVKKLPITVLQIWIANDIQCNIKTFSFETDGFL